MGLCYFGCTSHKVASARHGAISLHVHASRACVRVCLHATIGRLKRCRCWHSCSHCVHTLMVIIIILNRKSCVCSQGFWWLPPTESSLSYKWTEIKRKNESRPLSGLTERSFSERFKARLTYFDLTGAKVKIWSFISWNILYSMMKKRCFKGPLCTL